jgi:hypothetical protein
MSHWELTTRGVYPREFELSEFCGKSHKMRDDPDNVYYRPDTGSPTCRACMNANVRAYRARKRVARPKKERPAATPEETWSRWLPDQEAGEHWLWNGPISKTGYPLLLIRGRAVSARRYSWEKHRGKLEVGVKVYSGCGQPDCLNPDHLKLGAMKNDGVA